jgi:hypothetical protein
VSHFESIEYSQSSVITVLQGLKRKLLQTALACLPGNRVKSQMEIAFKTATLQPVRRLVCQMTYLKRLVTVTGIKLHFVQE